MSNIKRNFNKILQPNTQQPSILKPSPFKKQTNEQRMKQIYQSSSIKQKQKSKNKNGRRYYLPIPDRKLIQSDQDNQPKSSTRYRSYLQGEQNDKYNQPLTHRYQSNNQKSTKYEELARKSKNQTSNYVEKDRSIKRKMPSQLFSEVKTSKRNQSSQNLQNQLNKLNQNLAKNKNSRKLYNLEGQNNASKYRASSNYEQNPYQNQIFKIRRTTKKSLSGSLSKKPSENALRDDIRIQSQLVNPTGTKSQLSSPKNDLLEQGKQFFKNGSFKEALKSFEKGLQSQPKNMNFNYNIALIHLKQHSYEQGLKILSQIIQIDPSFKRTVYLFSSISCKHLSKISKAIQFANKGVSLFSNFVDLIFYRAKLYKEQNNTQQAIQDLQKVILLQKDHVQALYLLSFIYYERQLMTHVMSNLSSAIYHDQDKNSQYKQQALKLRAKIYLSEGKVKQAKRDILKLKVEKQNKFTSQVYFLLGKIQIQQNNERDALINFEKCLRQNNQPNSTVSAVSFIFPLTSPSNYLIPSLLEICKTKINIKDFYSAYHHINRSKHFTKDIDQADESLLRFKFFIEGVIFLMKRKVDEAMKDFQKFRQIQLKLTQRLQIANSQKVQKQNSSLALTKKQHSKEMEYFYPTFYLYRGFGYFMQNNHELAIKDYEEYQKSTALDKYTLYNMLLAKGITKITSHQFQSAVDYFNKCQQLFLKSQVKKIEPFIYRAMTLIEEARLFHYNLVQRRRKIKPTKKNTKLNKKTLQIALQQAQHQDLTVQEDNDIKVLELVFQALKQLDKACDINDSNSNLLFIRTLIYAYLNKFDESLDDVIKAISKSQENVPKYFFFRGMLQMTLQNKKQAVNDFNIAINLDNDYAPVYLARAKLYFQTQTYSKALEDLQKYSELRPEQDIEFHKAAMYLTNGLYPMAEEASQVVKNQQSQAYKEMKFHILLKLVKIQQAENFILPEYETDKILLRIIAGDLSDMYVSKGSEKQIKVPASSKIKFFSIIQYYHILGVAFFNLGEYQRAIQQFTIALKQCQLRDMEKNASSYMKKQSTDQNQQESSILGEKDVNCIMYNIFVCHLRLGQIRRAYEIFIRQITPTNQKMEKSEFITNFSHLLFQAMKKSNSSAQLQLNGKMIKNEDKEEVNIELFTNMFTDLLSPQILIETPTFLLKTKLCYLNVKSQKLTQQYSAKLYPEYVLNWLHVKEVQNRPEPPWVKRQSSDEGLIFTDHIQNINIEFQTTQHDQEESQDQSENDEDEQQQDENYECDQDDDPDIYQEDNYSNQPSKKKFDPRKFRDQIKLGDSIERKLNKIVNKNKSEEHQ